MPSIPSPTRTSLLALLDNARQELLTSFQGLAEEQMETPALDGWSVKDMLAHVAMWDEMELPDMRRAARGRARVLDALDDAYQLVDRWNDIQFALRKTLPLEQVLAELDEARHEIMRFLASVAEEHLTSGFVPAACAIQADHDREHAGHIRAWREKQGT